MIHKNIRCLCILKKNNRGKKVAYCMCIFCVLPHGTWITGITMYLGTPTTPAALVRQPNTNLQQHGFQRHISLSVLLWLPSPVFISFSVLRAFVTMEKKTRQDKSLVHFEKFKPKCWSTPRGNNNQIILSTVTLWRALMLPWHIHWKKLRGEQEDTQDDPDERRVNVYSFNTDKYSYVSAARI